LPEGGKRRVPWLLEDDCDSERGEGFLKKVKANAGMYASGIYEDWFGVKSVRVAFSTFRGEQRREYMRRRIREELRDEPRLLSRFVVTVASSPPDPYHLWL